MIFKKVDFEREEFSENNWKLWVPENLTQILIEKAHNPTTVAHGGIAKTLSRLKQMYYWPKMAVQVRNYISNCQVCKQSKQINQHVQPTIGDEVITERPFQKIYIDFLGKYPRSKSGNAYIFIVVDHLTKFTFLKAMKEATTINVAQFLVQEIFHKFGVPETIHSDNGAQFTSKSFTEMIETYKINHIKVAPYAPQSNASERVNQSVLAAIRSYLEKDHRDWDLYISEIECALRTAIHSATGTTPFFALFGHHFYTNGSDYKLARKLGSLTDHQLKNLNRQERLQIIREKIRENMHLAYEKSSERYNKRASL